MKLKSILIILLSALSLTAVAQSKKTVAVLDPICRDNSVNAFFQQMVRGSMESAITASAEYEAYDRSAFDMIQKEQVFQRTGAVNDSQIKKMGEMAGVDYVLVSEVSAYEGYLSVVVKILNVTTGKYDKSVDDYMQLNPGSVRSTCTQMASSLFPEKKHAVESISNIQTQVEPKPTGWKYEQQNSSQSNKYNGPCDYNTALVKMLDKEYDSAQKILDCITNKDAKTYYLAAVLAARTKNELQVYSNLTQCVKLDASYKVKAKKDSEFKRYWEEPDFKRIVY